MSAEKPAPEETTIDLASVQGAERVLFVDDEEPILAIAKTHLEIMGYRVDAQIDSLEALKVFQADPSRFGIVITDYAMTKMTGIQLAKELVRIRPDIPIILCTGFLEGIDDGMAKAVGIREFVRKPIISRALERIIRRILDPAEATATDAPETG